MSRVVCIFYFIAFASFVNASGDELLVTVFKFVKDCGNKPVSLCLKARALHYIDSHRGDIELTNGIKLTKTDEFSSGRSINALEFSNDWEIQEDQINEVLVDRISRFLSGYSLQFKVPNESIQEMQRSLDEARGKKKKARRILMPLLMLFKLKAVALLPLAIGFLAFVAFKALIVGKLALILSGIVALKKLLEAKNSTQNYEVVAHPQYSQSSLYDDHGHYARSLDSHNIAYASYNE